MRKHKLKRVKSNGFENIKNKSVKYEKEWINLRAFLLYTKEDRELSLYLESKEKLKELDYCSGENVLVYLLKDPNKYAIADYLELKYTKLPCIVFYEDLEAKDIFYYHIEEKESLVNQFRLIFTYARDCCNKHEKKRKKYKCLKKKLKIYKIGQVLKPVLKDAVPIAIQKGLESV